MPRVLHVSQSVNTGVAYCVGDWVREQRIRGWEVVVASPGGTLAQRCSSEGATIEMWRAERQPAPSVAREIRDLAAIVERIQPDVVHLHSAKAGLAGRLLIRGRRPTVFSPHAWSYLAVTGPMRTLTLQWERAAARWTSAFVCVSESERNRGVRDGIRGRLVVLPNQVDLREYASILSQSADACRDRLELGPAPLAVCVGRLAVQKGQDLLLQSWPLILERCPEAQLVLIGDGPMRSALETAAGHVRNVRLLGLQDRETTLRWMRAADVVVSPSRWEGMSLVTLEAGALSIPVVATDVDGIREAFPNGVGVRIVPVGAVDELAASVVDALGGKVPASPGPGIAGESSSSRLVRLYEDLIA